MRTNTGQILYIPRIGQRADFQHPLMRGCVGWWPLTDGAGGILKDISGNGLDATLNGSVAWDSGELGSEVNLDGGYIDSAVGTTGLGLTSTDKATISLWFKRRDVGASVLGNLFGNLDAGAAADIAVLPTKGEFSGGYDFFDITKNGTQRRFYSVPFTNFEYNNFVIVFDGINGSLYVDGVLHGTVSTFPSGNFSSTYGNIEIGGSSLSSFDAKGDLQNVRVWNRSLSSSEILQLYTNPWSGLSMPSETRYFFLSSPSPTINPFSRIITSSTILNKSGKTVIRRGA